MSGPLDDITVLEIANWVAAPSCSALMADMGATVVKVEPLGGDSMRGKLRQPAWPEGAPKTDIPFQLDNRGKKSIAVDLNDPRGGDIVRDLAARADVVITNLLPVRLEKYGISYDQLRVANPSLIYAVVSGFGTTGDERDTIAFDVTAFFGRGGVIGLLGEPDEPPPAPRPGQGDHPTGLALLAGVLAALRVRDRTGEGQVVETALMRTAAWTIGCDVSVALVDKQQPNKRARNQSISPMNTRYRCADGTWVILSAHDQGAWPRFCHAVGRPELIDDERFATPAERFRNGELLIGIFDEMFASQPYDYWAPRLAASRMIWGKIATLPDLVDDPSARGMGMYTTVEHPVVGSFETLSAPFTLSSSDVVVRGPAPEVGENTDEVLRRNGVDDVRIKELRDAGVVGG